MTSITDDTRFWDRIARKYASDPIDDLPGYERTLERTAALLAPTDTVLEIGCGTGTTALRLAPSVHRLVATDVSGGMIAIAREKAALGAQGNLTFEAAPAAAPPGAAGEYDAVLAFNLLHLLSDRPDTLQRIRQLLKPGGLFISKTACMSEMNVFIRYAVPVMQVLGKAPTVSYFTAPELEAEIASAGFEILESARHGSKPKDARIFIAARRRAAP